jgi:hypothetical protein
VFLVCVVVGLSLAPEARAQTTAAPTPTPWRLMQYAAAFLEFNHQGSERGGDEFVVPNWWMGMASRVLPRGELTLTSMFSLDPATVGRDGYRELFQSGETLDGEPLVDRQHPHDLFMQLAAIWRIPFGGTSLALAAAPSGEPSLGPTAFMHRASSGDNPTAPLSHHKLDSTHVSFGVLTAAVDRGRWSIEASLFNGREPDDNRWDFDFGRLDSVAARLWFRPAPQWEVQASSGRLVSPEELEPGNIVRSTASISWTRADLENVAGFTAAYGRNDEDHGRRQALLVEAARQRGANAMYTRLETIQIDEGSTLAALTLGGSRRIVNVRGVDAAIGADATFHRTPEAAKPEYGAHPFSLHLFLRLRPRASMGRMWNMRMVQPAPAADPHAGHRMN